MDWLLAKPYFTTGHKKANNTYNGKVEKKKKSKVPSYVVCYWGMDESYDEDGEDFNMPVHELAVDFIVVIYNLYKGREP